LIFLGIFFGEKSFEELTNILYRWRRQKHSDPSMQCRWFEEPCWVKQVYIFGLFSSYSLKGIFACNEDTV